MFLDFGKFVEHHSSHTLLLIAHCLFPSLLKDRGEPATKYVLQSLIFWGTGCFISRGRSLGGGANIRQSLTKQNVEKITGNTISQVLDVKHTWQGRTGMEKLHSGKQANTTLETVLENILNPMWEPSLQACGQPFLENKKVLGNSFLGSISSDIGFEWTNSIQKRCWGINKPIV